MDCGAHWRPGTKPWGSDRRRYRQSCRITPSSRATLTGLRPAMRESQPPIMASSSIFASVPSLASAIALEAPQHGLAAPIGITEGALEGQELGDVLGQLRLREAGHAGSARATSRNRSVATRRYAEVDSGRRWPRMSPIILGGTPSSSSRQAWVWRNTWLPR